MDLNQLDTEQETARIELFHPASGDPLQHDDGTPWYIEVYSTESAHYRKVQRQLGAKYLTRQRKTGRVDFDLEGADDLNDDLLVKSVAGWNLVYEGEQFPCTEENVRNLFRQQPRFRRQVQEGQADARNFFQASSDD